MSSALRLLNTVWPAFSEPRPSFIVRPLALNTIQYLYRCLLAARHVPGLSMKFVMDMYRGTVLGKWYFIIRALLPTLGMIAIFQHVSAFQPGEIPYGLYMLSGMTLWTIFGTGLSRGARALRRTRKLQFRLAIPRLVYIFASAAYPATFLLIFGAALVCGVIFQSLYSGHLYLNVDWPLLLAPVPIILAFALYVGISSFTSVIFLFARDIRMIISLLVQLWFLFTPVMYTMKILPRAWQIAVVYLNPVTTLIELFRWSLFGVGMWTWPSLAVSVISCLAVFFLGARFLMRSEWALREMTE